MFSFRGNGPSVPPKELTEEQRRRLLRDLAVVVHQLGKNFQALQEGLETVAMACDQLGLKHDLGGIIEKLREPVAAPEELPRNDVISAAPNLGPTRDLTKAVEYTDEMGNKRVLGVGQFLGLTGTHARPERTVTAQEIRICLETAGARYADNAAEMLRLGRYEEVKYRDLPISRAFYLRFVAAWRERQLPGDPDTALLELGWRGVPVADDEGVQSYAETSQPTPAAEVSEHV
jgi:hypothetical protein